VKKRINICGLVLTSWNKANITIDIIESNRRIAKTIVRMDGKEKRSLRWREKSSEDNLYIFSTSIRMLPTIRATDKMMMIMGLT